MGRPKGKALTLHDVLAAGREVVERDGGAALTVTNVARQLGIQPPSLCHHVPSNEELAFRLAEQGWSELAAQIEQIRQPAAARERLLAYAHALRRFARARPRCFELMQRVRLPHARVRASPLWGKLVVPLFEGFRALGVREARLVHATRALRSAVTGFLLLELAGQFQMDGHVDESFAHMLRALLDGLCE